MKILPVGNQQNRTNQSNQPNFQASLQVSQDRLIPGHLIGVAKVRICEGEGSGAFMIIEHALQTGQIVFSVWAKTVKTARDLLAMLSIPIDKAANPRNEGIVDVSSILKQYDVKDV